MDFDLCYRAVEGRDARFDGMFFTAVTSTGIYCRPSCPSITPRRENVRFFRSAAAAHEAGFRACKRCRPDAVPGSPEWNARADAVGRAMRLIADGEVERSGVSGLARRLGYTSRHLHRLLHAEVGAGPLALARAQRSRAARILLESSALPVTDVAFASGFASVRQFNDTIRAVFALTPGALRARARAQDGGTDARTARSEPLHLRLAYRRPLAFEALARFLALRAVPGVEEWRDGAYRRVLRLAHGLGVVSLSAAASPEDGTGEAGTGHVLCTLHLDDLRDLTSAVERCRRLLDLDADPLAVARGLERDPVLGPRVRAHPGLRVPGHVDPEELAVRAVLGQQVSVAAARTLAGRLSARYGQPLPEPDGTLRWAFPTPTALAGADAADLAMPGRRRRTLVDLCERLADGSLVLDAGADRDEAEDALLRIPGIGPWTTAYIRMRALSDPDAFMPTDLGVRHALERLGLGSVPARASEAAEAWRPWRSYALQHLWEVLDTEPAAPSARPGSQRRAGGKTAPPVPLETVRQGGAS